MKSLKPLMFLNFEVGLRVLPCGLIRSDAIYPLIPQPLKMHEKCLRKK
jgi:hypothetical protein